MIELLMSNVGIVLAAIGAIIGAIFYGKKVGKLNAETTAVKRQAAEHEAVAVKEIDAAKQGAATEVKTINEASNVQNDINKLGPGAAADELRDKWTRD